MLLVKSIEKRLLKSKQWTTTSMANKSGMFFINKIGCIPLGLLAVMTSMVVGADVAVDDVIFFEVDGRLVEGLALVDNLTSDLQALVHRSSVKNLNFTHRRQKVIHRPMSSVCI